MIGRRAALRLPGCAALDPRARRIGLVGRVLFAVETGQPDWITVQSGLLGTRESVVPLAGAVFDDEVLRVLPDKRRVRWAPRVPLTAGELRAEHARALAMHYGLHEAAPGADRLAEPGAAVAL